MALAKLDDGGGPVAPPPTKPGSSSPPPNGGSSANNQPSNANNGKKPEGGKNKNKNQPEAKKPAATQPVTAPKGETLAEAIRRMFAEGYNGHQVHDQIKKWHPNWTEFQIDQAMMNAPKSDKPTPASPNKPKRDTSRGGGIKELKRDVARIERIVHSAERVAGAELRRDRQLARTIQRDADREARRIAHLTTKAIGRELERDHRLLRDVRREVAKERGRLSRDIEQAVPRIERRIAHDLAVLDKDVLKHLPSARAIAQWTGTISSFAAVAGLVLPPPADLAAESIALGLAEVSITASTVDAIKHPNDPGRTVDALVQIGLARLGVSGSTTGERTVRGAAALISQLYYDFLRKGH